MALLLSHAIFTQPGFGLHHPLSIPRHAALMQLCEALGWLQPGEIRDCPLIEPHDLRRFHDPRYLAALEAAAKAGVATPEIRARYNLGTMECPVFEGLWDRARASVGGAVLAARLALDGEVPFHPGGGTHHGRPDRASGFCYLNDPVFAVLTLLDAGLGRVLYVDLDAHHGDGVQDAFIDEPRVMTISLHEAGRWPGSGLLEDRGAGRARNLPVPAGLNDSELGVLIEQAIVPVGGRFSPEAVVITCGTDALAGDPLSRLEVSNTALWDAVDAVRGLARYTVVLGGGGYNPWTLARAWAGLWARLSGRSVPERLPEAAKAVLARVDCDLVDEDERNPTWFDTIADSRNDGAVRGEIRHIVAATCAA